MLRVEYCINYTHIVCMTVLWIIQGSTTQPTRIENVNEIIGVGKSESIKHFKGTH